MAKKAAKKVSRKKAVKAPKTTAVAVKQQSSPAILSLSNPEQIMHFGKVLRDYIKRNNLSVTIENRGEKKEYPLAGAWKFAGSNFGLLAMPGELIRQHEPGQYVTVLYSKIKVSGKRKDGSKYEYEKEAPIFIGFANDAYIIDQIRNRNKVTRETTKPYYSYKCKVDIVRASDEKVVGKGESVCSNLESLKSGFDEHAVMGMAQTRTIARGFKNLLDFILVEAGYEPTPAEEMTKEMMEDAEVVGDDGQTIKKGTVGDKFFDTLVERAKKGEDILGQFSNDLDFSEAQKEVLTLIQSAK